MFLLFILISSYVHHSMMQSQFHLRQLRDEYMSRSEIWHIHAGNPCFLCTFRDSFAAMHIALQDLPEDSVSPTFSGMGGYK